MMRHAGRVQVGEPSHSAEDAVDTVRVSGIEVQDLHGRVLVMMQRGEND